VPFPSSFVFGGDFLVLFFLEAGFAPEPATEERRVGAIVLAVKVKRLGIWLYALPSLSTVNEA
jgi:hypothetical protein